MGIIAWIVLGLGAGLLANMAIPGKRKQGVILICLIGIVGALIGGWTAAEIFRIHSLRGSLNASTWLTAIAGAAVLLLAYHLFTSQSGRSRSGDLSPGSASVTRTADPAVGAAKTVPPALPEGSHQEHWAMNSIVKPGVSRVSVPGPG